LNIVIKPGKHTDKEGDQKNNMMTIENAALIDVSVSDAQPLSKNADAIDNNQDALVANSIVKTDTDIIKETNIVVKEANDVNSDSIGIAQVNKIETRVVNAPPKPLIPLQALIKLSLIDARSKKIIDVALVDSYSSSIRKPNYDNFLMEMINQYANKITIM
jgi:hypothetical protein